MRLSANNRAGINDKVVAQFAYDVIYSITKEEKEKLPSYLYKQINNEKRAKRFSYKSSTDQKRELFSYLNIGFFWTFVDLRRTTAKEYHSVLKKYKEENPVAALSVMCKRGISITSDLEYAFFLEQMSKVITSGDYVRNMEVLKIGNVLRKWSKKIRVTNEEEELEWDAVAISRLIGAFLLNHKHIEAYTGITEYEFSILNYLYQRRNNYVDIEYIWNEFHENIPKRKVPYSINKLVAEHLIQKHADWHKKEYTITKLGLRVIHQFRDRIFKSFNF